jgi:hypothetical protein
MKLEINIESLRLEGVGPVPRHELAALIELHLNRLIAAGGIPPELLAGGDLRVDLSRVRIAPGSSPDQAGAEIARHIAGSWSGKNGSTGREAEPGARRQDS